MRFLAKKLRLTKSTAQFSAKKRWHSQPFVGLSWDSPPLPLDSVGAGVRPRHNQIFSHASIGYQICLPNGDPQA